MVKIFAEAQYTTFTMHMPRKGFGDRSFRQRVSEDFADGIPHLSKLRFTIGINRGKHHKDICSFVAPGVPPAV
jgi:hypothetical protein